MPDNKVIAEIICELQRACSKFPTWPTDPLHSLAVLGEEFGELTKAVLQMVYEPHNTTRSEVKCEAIQTAAMAVRFASSLDSYVYAPASQHPQRLLSETVPWIPVTSQLPDDETAVRVAFTNGEVWIGWHEDGRWSAEPNSDEAQVSHWQHLRAAPGAFED